MNTKVNEGKLISGKEALIALANKIPIEYTSDALGEWFDVNNSNTLGIFERSDFKFRLKPRTITLNGIEVPAPFEPKVGEGYFYLNAKYKVGYSKTMREPLCNQDNKNIENGAWRTEEEIKQVVAALRQVFGGSHDN